MEHIVYHQPRPHLAKILGTGRSYVFTTKIGVSLAIVPKEDANILLATTERCCGNKRRHLYKRASPAQIRLWNGASRPEHFDPRYEKDPEMIEADNVPEEYSLPWPRVTVIVPVWNRVELTWRFIEAFAQYGNFNNAELVMVDNGSTDATNVALTRWTAAYPEKLLTVTHEVNKGVSHGYNAGVTVAKAPFLLFMNNDVEVAGDVITPLVRALLSDADSLYGPRVIRHNGQWNAFKDVIVPYVEGWFLGCTKETFDLLGGFDPRYSPCDMEDVDFSYTAVKKGLSLKELQVPAKHFHMGSSASQLTDRRTITVNNKRRFADKWGLVQ